MTTTERSTVVGVFRERDEARDAIEALKDNGFDAQDIGILSPDKEETRAVAEETGAHAGSGAATGAVAGGILGGLGGWLVGIGALAIPGIGPFIAAGAFATALGGAAIGAGVGAIAGALAGMGVPDDEAKYYEGEVESGRTLVTVRTSDRYAEAQRLLRQHGAYDIESGRTPLEDGSLTSTATESDDGAAARTLELRAEELEARKTSVETGQVSVAKEVVEHERTLDVPVTREEVYVERRPVDRVSDTPIDGAERTIEVPIREERVELEKRPVVYEEVQVGKQQVHGTQQVSDTVQHEEARIERVGEVTLSGDSPADELTTDVCARSARRPALSRALVDRHRVRRGARLDNAESREHPGRVRETLSAEAGTMPPARRSPLRGRHAATDRRPWPGPIARPLAHYRAQVQRAVGVSDADVTSALEYLSTHPFVRSTRDLVERVLHSITKERVDRG